MRSRDISCYCIGCQRDFHYETKDWMVPVYCDECMKDRVVDELMDRRGNIGNRRKLDSCCYVSDNKTCCVYIDRRQHDKDSYSM